MSSNSDFEKFLKDIEPSKTTKNYISSVHNNLRYFLENHDEYKDKIVETFLSGSYAKNTNIRPSLNDGKTDVDIVVVTNYSDQEDSKVVLDELYDICTEKYNNITKQSRSIGIEMSGIEIDVVPMIECKSLNIYKIGNKNNGTWKLTNPKGHLEWCTEMNKKNNNRFVHIVKIFKWWRRVNCPESRKYPKGITLEKIISDNIHDCTDTYENIVYNTMKNIMEYLEPYIEDNNKPFIADPGINTDDLSEEYEFEDFKSFYNKIKLHVNKLNKDGFSNDTWREILGERFPKKSNENNSSLVSSYVQYNSIFNVSHKKKMPWEEDYNISNLDVTVKCFNQFNDQINYDPDGNTTLGKKCRIEFSVVGGALLSSESIIQWQVVNTGYEAEINNCLRGGFEACNYGNFGRYENTAYSGTHWVQAFVINNGRCVAKSKEILVKVR